jgi:hypothetical protein
MYGGLGPTLAGVITFIVAALVGSIVQHANKANPLNNAYEEARIALLDATHFDK